MGTGFDLMMAVDPSYQFLACRYLREQLDTLRRELHGVRLNEDIEPVHQARVASRRIRAALRMFSDCFEPRRRARWERQVKRLTRELGAARDTDVQIEFAVEFLSHLDEKDKAHRPGVERLVLRLRQSRQALQPQVIAVLDKLDRRNTLAEMYGRLEETLFTLGSHDTGVSSPYVHEMAASHISARRKEVAACEPALDDPQDVHGHHQLRIAAKKLRYTLEICDLAYGGQLASVIRAVKQAQAFLGDIHDCDVWVQDIDRLLEEERLATIEYYGQSRPFNRLRPGLLFVRAERLSHRRQVFDELIDYWKESDAKRIWETLEDILQSRRETTEAPCGEPKDRRIDAGEEQEQTDCADQ
jgi:CHAD domain-containing protein